MNTPSTEDHFAIDAATLLIGAIRYLKVSGQALVAGCVSGGEEIGMSEQGVNRS